MLSPMRYSLRTLLVVLALGPPVLAGAWFIRVELGLITPLVLFLIEASLGVLLYLAAVLAVGFGLSVAIASTVDFVARTCSRR